MQPKNSSACFQVADQSSKVEDNSEWVLHKEVFRELVWDPGFQGLKPARDVFASSTIKLSGLHQSVFGRSQQSLHIIALLGGCCLVTDVPCRTTGSDSTMWPQCMHCQHAACHDAAVHPCLAVRGSQLPSIESSHL